MSVLKANLRDHVLRGMADYRAEYCIDQAEKAEANEYAAEFGRRTSPEKYPDLQTRIKEAAANDHDESWDYRLDERWQG